MLTDGDERKLRQLERYFNLSSVPAAAKPYAVMQALLADFACVVDQRDFTRMKYYASFVDDSRHLSFDAEAEQLDQAIIRAAHKAFDLYYTYINPVRQHPEELMDAPDD